MKWKKFLPIIGIGIFIFILSKLDLSQIIEEVVNARIDFLIVSFFIMLAIIFTETFKWFIIAKFQKIKVPFLKAVRIHLMSSFYGFVTPGRLGSMMRARYLKKYTDGKIGKGLSNFVIEKVLDLVAICFIVIVTSVIFKNVFSGGNILYFIGLFFVCIFGIWFILNKKLSKKFLKIIYRKLVPMKFKEKARESFYSFYENIPTKKEMILFFFVNLLNWFALGFQMFWIGKAVGIEINFFYFLGIWVISTLVSQIPITISGLGTREATLIGLFSIFNIEATKVFSMSMIGLAFGFFPAIIGFILSLKKEE